jgi:hypothetical protein
VTFQNHPRSSHLLESQALSTFSLHMKGSLNTGRPGEHLQEDKQTKISQKISYSSHPIIPTSDLQAKYIFALLLLKAV